MNLMQEPVSLDREGRKYLYRQIADLISEQIQSKRYLPGDRLPSLDSLSSEFNVNRLTVRKAVRHLIDQGLLHSIPSQGTYVSNTPSISLVRPENRPRSISIYSTEFVNNELGPYHVEMLNGMRQEIAQYDAVLSLLDAGRSPAPSFALEQIRRAGADGIICVGPQNQALLGQIVNQGPPAVVVDNELFKGNADCICIDNVESGYLGMKHLLELGHTEIVVVGGYEGYSVNDLRHKGVQKALAEKKGSSCSVTYLNGDFNRHRSAEVLKGFLETDAKFTAMLFFNDEMAVTGLQALYQFTSKRIPDDVSIVAIDGTIWTEGTNPRLTSVHIPARHMGMLAIRQLMTRIESEEFYPSRTCVSLSLVEKGSTARVDG